MGWKETLERALYGTEEQRREDRRAARLLGRAEARKLWVGAKKIDYAPWWRRARDQFVCEYTDIAQLNRELAFLSELGWYIDSTSGAAGHINVGRTATTAVLTGGLSLLLGASRSKDKVTVHWRRQRPPQP